MIETLIRRTIDPKWKCSYGGMAALQLQNGLESLPGVFSVPEISDERVIDYIVYQIYRNRQMIVEGRWKLAWLFSQMSLDKYKKQFISENGKSGMNYYINQWLDEFELSRSMLTAMIEKPKPNPLKKLVYMESEEPIKKRFAGTESGLALCHQATTGWSPFSETCSQCVNRTECEMITEKKFPELVRIRKETYGSKKK